MADIIRWIPSNGSAASVGATIGNIKQTGNISKYVFSYIATNGGTLTNSGESSRNGVTMTYTRGTAIAGSATFTVEGKIKWTGGGQSNGPSKTVMFKQPLDKNCVSNMTIKPSEVWSNSSDTPITVSYNFTAIQPYTSNHTISSNQTVTSGKGSIANTASSDKDYTCTWKKGTSTTDVGSQFASITIYVNSTTASASAEAAISSASLTVKNAVTGLTLGTTSVTLYRGSTYVVPVTFTPTAPYSKTIGYSLTSSSSSSTGISISADGANGKLTITTSTSSMAASHDIYAYSDQTASKVTSNKFTLTTKVQSALTGKNIYELGNITVSGGMNNVKTATVNTGSGYVSATPSGSAVVIKSITAISANTYYKVTVTDIYGATNTITGTVLNTTEGRVTLNIGDTYAWESGVGIVSKISSNNTSIATGDTEASTGLVVVTAKAEGTATLTITGTDGGTNTIEVKVAPITLTLS